MEGHNMALTLLEIKRHLRRGRFVWPGGYPLFFITRDGGTLCFDCVRKEWRNVRGRFSPRHGVGVARRGRRRELGATGPALRSLRRAAGIGLRSGYGPRRSCSAG